MMRTKKMRMDKRKLSLLGGSALFGYLGCQLPGAGTTDPDVAAPKDTVAIAATDTTKSITLKPDPTPLTEPVIVRNGPTLGEACPPAPEWSKDVCSVEGVILACPRGVRVERNAGLDRYCVMGDTIMRTRHFGFTGIEKAGMLCGRVRILRAHPARV